MNKDLTVGKADKVLRDFCIPLFASIIFQQLYNLADSFVAGKFVGEDALAAVGNSYEITLIFLAFAFGCNIGCSVIVSKYFGAKRNGDVKTTVSTAVISTAVLCAVLMTAGLIFSGRMLTLIKTPESVFELSKIYLDIYILGLPFVFFYNIATGIFSALGDSKTPFYFLMFSSVANIGADILFTTALSSVFTKGVDGVAWATFICQGISCILAIIFVFRRLKKFGKTEKTSLFSKEIFLQISKIAIPSILQQSFISIGNIIIQGMINGFGTGVMAGYSAAIKLNNLVITSFTTLANGISNFTAQNIGAEKLLRVKEGFKAGIKLVWIICLPMALLYIFCSKQLVYFFLDEPSADALQTGINILRMLSPFYFVVSAKLVSDGVLRGSGMMKKFMIATFTDLILRVTLAWVFSSFTPLGATGIWLAWPVGWSTATVMSLMFYKSGEWNHGT